MTDFYMNYLDLCKEKNLQPVSDEAAKLWGVSKAAISGWKNKDSMPSGDAMFKMMQYFDIAIPVLEDRKMFLENHAYYIIVEGRINGKLAIQSCYDIFHTDPHTLGFNIKNHMLALEPESTMILRAATPDEIKMFNPDDPDNTINDRYKVVSEAEAHKIFHEKTGQFIKLESN